MSLLSVTVKKAQFAGAHAAVHQWNSYVTLKLQHVKSTTVTVKGATPSWEQDFLFEVNNLDAGLLVEVWNKGLIWDKAAGYHWLHLRDIQHSNMEGTGQWLPLDAELVMRDGEVVGTKTATGHAVLIDARFELPYATELEGDEAVELQRKLEMLNSMLDQEARAEQARKQHQYYIQSGVSEDSDYTSDVNYPVGQHPNSSASQFLSVAHQLNTPQRSLNSSRENSYEKDDDYYRANGSNHQHSPYYPPKSSNHRKQLPTIPTKQTGSRNPTRMYWDDPARDSETDPLYYNSRPQSNYKSYGSRSYRRGNSWEDEYNQKRPDYSRQYNEEFEDAQEYSQPTHNYAKRLKNNQRGTPSLERQYTLYDDGTGDYVGDEEVRDVNSKSTPYVSDPYTTYNQENAHKDSVYNEYNQQYSDYVPDETAYGDGYTDAGKIIGGYDQYVKDSSYSYDGWKEGVDTRDQYTAPVKSKSKSSKELPQIPSHYNRKTHLPTPFTLKSTVKEASVASPAVQSVPQTQHAEAVTSKYAISSGGYGNIDKDRSFYDGANYNNRAPVDHSSSVRGIDAATPTTTANNDHTEQYMDSYENQVGYEDWQNYGYYDEAGNYIQYDQNSYYQDSSNLIPEEVPIQPPQTSEKDAYSYYDQTDSTAFQAPAADATVASVHQDPDIYNEQYDDTNYYPTSEADQRYQTYDPNAQEAQYSYDQDGYWYDASDAVTLEQDPDRTHLDATSASHKDPQSSVEYNYAYKSAENLAAFEPGHQKLEKSESISRRASFRRQASTRGDYPSADGILSTATSHLTPNHIPTSKPTVITSIASSTTTTAPTASNVAVAAANKLTSDIKSALPGLSSLTKGKSDLFTSSFSKLGSFVSSAAAKTGVVAGVNVPLISTNQNVTKEKETVNQLTTAPIQPHHDLSMDQGLGYSLDEQQYPYDHWNGHYEEQHEGYDPNKYEHDEYHHHEHEGGEGHIAEHEKGPVHMDSLESNASEGARDAEDFEAEYWQKQKERIDKQSSLQAQDSQDYYQYDNYPDSSKPNLLQSMDSTDDPTFDNVDFRQNSLDREEWLKELEKQQGGKIHPSLSKKDTMDMSLDRSESIDQQTDYGDEFDQDQDRIRQESLESGDAYPLSPPPQPKISEPDEGPRKSSLEIEGKEKGHKTVSFEEEPPKIERQNQTKGMTPREKWLWATNRICANLAVRK